MDHKFFTETTLSKNLSKKTVESIKKNTGNISRDIFEDICNSDEFSKFILSLGAPEYLEEIRKSVLSEKIKAGRAKTRKSGKYQKTSRGGEKGK